MPSVYVKGKPPHSRLSDEEVADKICGILGIGEAALVRDLSKVLKVPQFRVRDTAEVDSRLDLLVGMGRSGAVWHLAVKDYQVERVQ